MITLKALDTYIDKTAAALAAEDAKIADAVAAKSIGNDSTYWQTGYRLRSRLQVATALRDAIAEVVA